MVVAIRPWTATVEEITKMRVGGTAVVWPAFLQEDGTWMTTGDPGGNDEIIIFQVYGLPGCAYPKDIELRGHVPPEDEQAQTD
jgi:hypothetical protein